MLPERPHGQPEQEAAVQYLIEHWKSFRLEGKLLRRTSVPLTELYDECIGIRTTLWGPGAGFRVKGGVFDDLDALVILVPANMRGGRYWYDLNHDYRPVGRLVKIGMAK